MQDTSYELIDFGDGRKLERFGETVFDRPAPVAEHDRKSKPDQWKSADVQYKRNSSGDGCWESKSNLPDSWPIELDHFRMRLHPTPAGQLGVFPEQATNWTWIRRQISRADRQLRVINLFGYTGGSTLAASAAGAEVVHVDAAKNIVGRARENAKFSQLDENPIRWICEDAVRFVNREVKRGNTYDGIILDPPSYGHGPKGEVWKIQTDLMPLLKNCRALLSDNPCFILLTCHTPSLQSAELQAMVCDAFFGSCSSGAIAAKLELKTKSGRKLPSGDVVRWTN